VFPKVRVPTGSVFILRKLLINVSWKMISVPIIWLQGIRHHIFTLKRYLNCLPVYHREIHFRTWGWFASCCHGKLSFVTEQNISMHSTIDIERHHLQVQDAERAISVWIRAFLIQRCPYFPLWNIRTPRNRVQASGLHFTSEQCFLLQSCLAALDTLLEQKW
jgi:hypothetical protein